MKLTFADKCLIGILLLMSIAGVGLNLAAISSSGNQVAEISVDGKVIKTVPLKEGYRDEFRLGDSEHYNIIEISDKRIRVREADCPDQICVNMGWVSMAPQQIVCLPNRLMIKIKAVDADLDDISR